MALDSVANFVKVTVSGSYDSAAYSISLSSGDGAKLPTPPFNLVWWNATSYPDPSDDPNVEIVRVTAVVGDVLTLDNTASARNPQEGTVASTKNTANDIYKMSLDITAKMITDIASDITTAGSGVMQGLPLTGSGTIWNAASAIPGNFSFVVDLDSGQFIGYQGYNYSVSGTTVTFTSAVPSGYNSLVLICYG